MKPALVLVDLQADYLMSAGLQPVADDLVSRASLLLKGCRQSGMLVIHVLTTVNRGDDRRLPHWRKANRWQCVSGTTGHEPPEPLRPLAGETVIHKTGFNPFASGQLETALLRAGCDTVLLAGLHLHACVRTAAVECLERNFQVRIAEDAVASNDPIHAAATRRWLAQRCVEFESVAALLTRIEGGVNSEIIHRSPRCSSEVLFQFPNASADEIATATQAARNAWPAWRHAESWSRWQVMEGLAVRLEATAMDLARQMAIEIGKPVRHGLEEVQRTAANLRDVIRCASAQSAEKRMSAGRVRCEPLGVIAVISAWNNPVAIPLGKIAPALAYGNTVLWKPAPAATRIARVLLQMLLAAGLPPDVVHLVNGDHHVAQKLAAGDEVNAVTLTGSSAGGYALAEICARRRVPFQAELSGNNAAIVWDDADAAHAATQVAWGAFAFAGQRCTANRRVIVPAASLETFLSSLQTAAAQLPWGDPLDEAVEIGPVINLAKRDKLSSLIARAQADGSAQRVIFPHETRSAESWVQRGAYAQPVIVCCDQPAHALVQEETMSPLLVVQPARDFDHALALCNGVRHGLAAALFSPSPERQRRFVDEAQAGILKLNSTTAGVDVTLPFGGWKASGVGPPEHGEADRLFYTRMQAVYGTSET